MNIRNLIFVGIFLTSMGIVETFAQCTEIPKAGEVYSNKTKTRMALAKADRDAPHPVSEKAQVPAKNRAKDSEKDSEKDSGNGSGNGSGKETANTPLQQLTDQAKVRDLKIDREAEINPSPDFATVTLSKNESIKLVVDQDVDSGYIKSEDYIQFLVAQDVYAKDTVLNLRCVIIPQGTKVFGVVDYAKGRTPFRIKGRARLEVYLTTLVLPEGTQVGIKFSEPYQDGDTRETTASSNRNDNVIRKCKYSTLQICIVGRLTRTTLAPQLVSAGANGLVGFEDASTARTVAFLSLIQGLGNATGVSDMINQSNAALKSKHVFEARTREETTVVILVPKEAPKKDDKVDPKTSK